MELLTEKKVNTKVITEMYAVLKSCFPGVEFEITHKVQGIHDVYRIAYTDGPAKVKVRKMVMHLERPYQIDGNVNGVKIVFERMMSDEVERLIIEETKEVFDIKSVRRNRTDEYVPVLGSTLSEYVWTIFCMKDF